MFLHLIPWLAIAWLVAAVLMLFLWMWHLGLHNAAVVDVGWAAGLAAVSFLYALFAEGDVLRRWIAAATMMIWGTRLSLFLLFGRVLGHAEDARYAELRRSRGDAANRWFFWFFQAQAFLVAVLSWPIAAAATDRMPGLSPIAMAGVAVWIVAVAGEGIADRQLNAFKRNPANRGRTCRAGLWRYSRHPNYFFEWLVWVGYALIATPSPGGTIAWFCPALMLFFLFRVTGIPATEAHAVKSRGEEYREYQRSTSAFVPWFRS